MNTCFKLICLSLLLLLASTALLCDEYEGVYTDSAFVKLTAQKVLGYFYSDNILAEDYIAWDSFSVNGEDQSAGYTDAYDNYEEDYFMDDLVTTINRQLRVTGDEDDYFTDWTVSKDKDVYTVTTHNRSKNVTMELQKTDKTKVFVYAIAITDR